VKTNEFFKSRIFVEDVAGGREFFWPLKVVSSPSIIVKPKKKSQSDEKKVKAYSIR
jgi:hypothetical protein